MLVDASELVVNDRKKESHRPPLWSTVLSGIEEQGLLGQVLHRFGFDIEPKRQFSCPRCQANKAKMSDSSLGRGGCDACKWTWSHVVDFLAGAMGRDSTELVMEVGREFGLIDSSSPSTETKRSAGSSPASPRPNKKPKPTSKSADSYCPHGGWVRPLGDRIPPKIAQVFASEHQGFSFESVQSVGGRYVEWKHPHHEILSQTAIGLPVLGRNGLSVCNWTLRPPMPGARLFVREGDKTIRAPKSTAYSAPSGVQFDRCGVLTTIAARELIRTNQTVGGIRVLKTEGESDLLAAITRLPEDEYLCWTNSDGARSTNVGEWFLPMLSKIAPVEWIVCHDADEAGQDGACRWCNAISRLIPGATVKNVVLPYPIEAKKGKDLRDYFRDGHTFADFEALVDSTERWKGTSTEQEEAPEISGVMEDVRVEEESEGLAGGEGSRPLSQREESKEADPLDEASLFLLSHQHRGHKRLLFWCGQFFYWSDGRFLPILASEVRTMVVHALNKRFTKVGTRVVSDVLEQVRAACVVSSQYALPSWLSKHKWSPNDVVATKNAIVHLPSFVEGKKPFAIHATPVFFSTCAMDYRFRSEKADCPNWKRFLSQLWGKDQDSIDVLQEWFGYCLTPDTRQQKILMMLGPKRSGKGTICRVLRSVVGEENVAGPTLSSLQTNFGLSPLLGKTVAIVSDARLSGRADQAIITERLLSISGEDHQTIDRKNREPVTTKLNTRFMIVSNELPRLQDSSGAFTGRMIVLRLTESFYGQEDHDLSQKLVEERAGILHWAIEGWARLRSRGSFVQPASGNELVEQLNELASPILSFVEDRCLVGDQYEVSMGDLYRAWTEWCQEAGREPSTSQTFGRDLSALLPRLKRRQVRFGAHRERFYTGIRLSD